MTQRTAEKVRGSECIIFSGGHFPTSEDPVKFKEVVSPVLRKIVANDPERRAQGGRLGRGSQQGQAGQGSQPQLRAVGGRRVIEL